MLNGGLPAWVAEGLPFDDTPANEAELAAPVLAARSPPADPHFHARLQARACPPNLPSASAPARHHKRLGLHTGSRKDSRKVLTGNAPAGSLPMVAAHSLQFLSPGRVSSVP